jgi:hypothetical protein
MALPVTLSGSQLVLGVKMRPEKKAKPPSYTKLVWYVKYLQKVLESLTGPADFESNFWGSPK